MSRMCIALLLFGCSAKQEAHTTVSISEDAQELRPYVVEAVDRWNRAAGVRLLIVKGRADIVVGWGVCPREGDRACAPCWGKVRNITFPTMPEEMSTTMVHEMGHALGICTHDSLGLMTKSNKNSSHCITEENLIELCDNRVCTNFEPEC